VQLDTVQIFDPDEPDTPFGWWEAGDHHFSNTEHAILNPSTAAQCRALWAKIGATVFGSVSEMARQEETDEELRTRIKNTYGLGAPEVVTRERYDRARRRLLRKWLELQRIEYARQAEVESFYGEAEKEEKKLRVTMVRRRGAEVGGEMTKPEQLFPGVEWEEWTPGGWCIHAGGVGYALTRNTVSGKWGAEVWAQEHVNSGIYGDQSEALAWLRARIIEHRDELCRVTKEEQ
jgi:hypothetical protein